MLQKKRIDPQTDKLALLSTLNVNGQRIAIHRSIHRLSFSWAKLVMMLLLPLAFNIATWWVSQPISTAWAALFEFWLKKLELIGIVTPKLLSFGLFSIAIPHLELPSRTPDALIWWVALITTIMALILTPLIPKQFLPLCYFMRFAGFIQITALVFFAVLPSSFPYTLTDYIESLVVTGVWFMFIIPWVHALIYYILDFFFWQKVWLTLLTLVFIAVTLPFQLMTHAYVLVKFSLLFLPIFYLLFGVFLPVLGCIGLYGWAMSWQHNRSGSFPT